MQGVVIPIPKARQTPLRRPNRELRTREHLTQDEVERLIKATKGNRHAQRDATMILIAFRHGLRVSELCDLQWTQVHFTSANLDVRRRKNGSPATHPLTGRELRALRLLKRKQQPSSAYLFVSERGAPFSTEGFARLLQRAGKSAGLTVKVHPHMLRHACGYQLANRSVDTRTLQAYLGHKNIQHTVRYTELASGRFKDFWKD
jgi:type 1 fimbriae regulatory protein FimB/type 1 fimbriae regulatory protein FimE